MLHEGKILEKAIRNSGVSIAFIAKKINYSRRHLYNLFENELISIELFNNIGKIINHDFTNEVKKIKKLSAQNSNSHEKEILYWKNKYLEILEKYNKLLEKNSKGK